MIDWFDSTCECLSQYLLRVILVRDRKIVYFSLNTTDEIDLVNGVTQDGDHHKRTEHKGIGIRDVPRAFDRKRCLLAANTAPPESITYLLKQVIALRISTLIDFLVFQYVV